MDDPVESPLIEVESYGKVLVTGGYLVLDPSFSGLVLSAKNVRLRVTLSALSNLQGQILIQTPQFPNAPAAFHLEDISKLSNPFLRGPLELAMIFEPAATGLQAFLKDQGLRITIEASKYFYDYTGLVPSPCSAKQVRELPEFPAFEGGFSAKTGLGSSAALVAALTSALILQFSDPPLAP